MCVPLQHTGVLTTYSTLHHSSTYLWHACRNARDSSTYLSAHNTYYTIHPQISGTLVEMSVPLQHTGVLTTYTIHHSSTYLWYACRNMRASSTYRSAHTIHYTIHPQISDTLVERHVPHQHTGAHTTHTTHFICRSLTHLFKWPCLFNIPECSQNTLHHHPQISDTLVETLVPLQHTGMHTTHTTQFICRSLTRLFKRPCLFNISECSQHTLHHSSADLWHACRNVRASSTYRSAHNIHYTIHPQISGTLVEMRVPLQYTGVLTTYTTPFIHISLARL